VDPGRGRRHRPRVSRTDATSRGACETPRSAFLDFIAASAESRVPTSESTTSRCQGGTSGFHRYHAFVTIGFPHTRPRVDVLDGPRASARCEAMARYATRRADARTNARARISARPRLPDATISSSSELTLASSITGRARRGRRRSIARPPVCVLASRNSHAFPHVSPPPRLNAVISSRRASQRAAFDLLQTNRSPSSWRETAETRERARDAENELALSREAARSLRTQLHAAEQQRRDDVRALEKQIASLKTQRGGGGGARG